MKKISILLATCLVSILSSSCEPAAEYNFTKPYQLGTLNEGNVVCDCLAYTDKDVTFRVDLGTELREITVPKKNVDFYQMHPDVDKFEGKPYVIYEYLGDKRSDVIESGYYEGLFLFIFPEHCINELDIPRLNR